MTNKDYLADALEKVTYDMVEKLKRGYFIELNSKYTLVKWNTKESVITLLDSENNPCYDVKTYKDKVIFKESVIYYGTKAKNNKVIFKQFEL